MISSIFLILGSLIAATPQSTLTPDELHLTTSNVVKIHARLQDRVGQQIEISGHSESLGILDQVTLPLLDRNLDSPFLELDLRKSENGWTIFHFHGLLKSALVLEAVQERRNSILKSDDSSLTHLLEKFLLRESPVQDQPKLWISFQPEDHVAKLAWLKLGSNFFSGKTVLKETIDKFGLAKMALKSDLYPYGQQWISEQDFLEFSGLMRVGDNILPIARVELSKLAHADLAQLINVSRREPNSSDIRQGTRRKQVRLAWGDPRDVEWIRFENHLLEDWSYKDKSVRMIDGRVFGLHIETQR